MGKKPNETQTYRMKKISVSLPYKKMFYIIMIFLIGLCFLFSSTSQSIDNTSKQIQEPIEGQILFSPMYSQTTYLLDANTKTINHTWPSDYYPGEAVYYLENGTILRTIKTGATGFGGSGGGIQKVLKNGSIVWDFRYTTTHHDIALLPNGNVLMLAWETKTYSETLQAGRIPNTFFGTTFTTEHIIEVKPTSPTTGDIVWEWHAWDHLIQDFANGRDNYGIVENHPELIDINYGINLGITDWLHANSIDYNEQLDQILISVHNFNEIWVIDHSTTTEEAAGSTGGLYGKGGDLLYRWGNPEAYRKGNSRDQELYSQHDATWIKDGCPGEGNILIFNNGVNRPGGPYSSVDEIVTPINEYGDYYLEPGSSYGPVDPIWTYTADSKPDFYSAGYSGAERLENGNTLICEGSPGRFFEVNPYGKIIWEYENPYTELFLRAVFKIVYIPPQQQESPNQPPKRPLLKGPSEGEIGIKYSFTAETSDPEGDSFSYLFDWGDGNTSYINGSFTSSQLCNASYTWMQEGEFQVRVKAIDTVGADSQWSTPLELTLPKTKNLFNIFIRFIENHPILSDLLQQILNLI